MSDGSNSEGSSPKGWLERLTQAFSGEPASRRELMTIIRDAAERSLLDAEALSIIDGAMAVSEMQARDIMIPRSQVVFVPDDAAPRDFLPLVIDSQHSRFPVLDEEADDVKGILHAKDLLPLLLSGKVDQFKLRDHMRPAPIIPESKRLNVLLTEFRENRNHMAIVVDEFGGTSGLITLEDVIEEIVGDISDEFDDDEVVYSRLDDHTYSFEGKTPLNDFYKVLEIEGSSFEEAKGESDTLAGFVLEIAGVFPEIDDVVEFDRYRFTVEAIEDRRIQRVKVECPEALDEGDAD